MTAPLTPPDCDLRGLSYMPLDVQRLRDSDLALISTGDEFKAAVLLWSISWSQVPAASLPDDDRLLAALVRLDNRAWKKVREVALRGWIKCSDGRLYHPVVAEKACDAWKDRTTYRAKREKDRARLEAWREAQKQSSGHNGNGDETQDETRFETQPEEKGTGSEGIKEPPNPLGGVRQDRFAEGWEAYPIAGRGNAGPAKASAEWAAAVERAGGEDALIGAIRAHAARLASDGSKAKNFDRWLRDDGFAAYLGQAVAAPVSTWSGPAEVWKEASLAMGEETVRTYLGRCAWQDSPVRAVIAPHEFAAGKLRSGAGAALASLGVQILVGEKAA